MVYQFFLELYAAGRDSLCAVPTKPKKLLCLEFIYKVMIKLLYTKV